MTTRTAAPSALITLTSALPLVSRVLKVAVQWDQRRRTRKDLRGLTDYMLCDIGLNPVAAAAEAAKPFWRA